jgi:Fe-S-cluster containining protein
MGCTGACCAAFPIGASLDWVKGGRVTDGDLLGFMLRQITHVEAAERRSAFPGAQPINPAETYYRCIYWDETTHLCTAYEHRPGHMCGEYPYPPTPGRCDKLGRPLGIAGVCEHGCDCKGAPLLSECED